MNIRIQRERERERSGEGWHNSYRDAPTLCAVSVSLTLIRGSTDQVWLLVFVNGFYKMHKLAPSTGKSVTDVNI